MTWAANPGLRRFGGRICFTVCAEERTAEEYSRKSEFDNSKKKFRRVKVWMRQLPHRRDYPARFLSGAGMEKSFRDKLTFHFGITNNPPVSFPTSFPLLQIAGYSGLHLRATDRDSGCRHSRSRSYSPGNCYKLRVGFVTSKFHQSPVQVRLTTITGGFRMSASTISTAAPCRTQT